MPPQVGELQFAFIILVLIVLLGQPQDGFLYTLSSWYRDPQRNREVGGQSNSLHQVGLGLDVVVEDMRGLAARLADSLLAEGTSVFARGVPGAWRSFGPAFQALVESDHVHLELDLS